MYKFERKNFIKIFAEVEGNNSLFYQQTQYTLADMEKSQLRSYFIADLVKYCISDVDKPRMARENQV